MAYPLDEGWQVVEGNDLISQGFHSVAEQSSNGSGLKLDAEHAGASGIFKVKVLADLAGKQGFFLKLPVSRNVDQVGVPVMENNLRVAIGHDFLPMDLLVCLTVNQPVLLNETT